MLEEICDAQESKLSAERSPAEKSAKEAALNEIGGVVLGRRWEELSPPPYWPEDCAGC